MCLFINFLIGFLVFEYVLFKLILLFINGVSVFLLIFEKVGVIIKNVKNSVSLIRIWFGGIDCVVSEVLINDRIMMMWVK